MNRNQFVSVSFVRKPISRRRSNKVIPTGHQQNYRTIRNRWVSNRHEVLANSSSPSFENIDSSFSSQRIAISPIHQEKLDSRDVSRSSVTVSGHLLPFENFIRHNDDVLQRTRRLEFSSIVTRIWLTIVSLTVLLIAIYLLLSLIQTSVITTTTTVTTSTTTAATTNQSYYCSGVSPYTLWSMNIYGNVYMNINTSQCNFNSTPLYFTSMGGDTAHFTAGGYTAIYSPAKDSFTIYATPIISYTIAIMFNYSQTYRWNINWVGILE